MPGSVKRFTKSGKSHAFYDPTPILLADFALPAFSLHPYPGDNHPSPTSQFVLSQHSFFKCWYLLYINVKIFLHLLSPHVFRFLPYCGTAPYLLSVPACGPSGVRDTHFSYFHHLLLWSSVETRNGEGQGACVDSSFVLSSRTKFLSSYKFCGRLIERSCSPGLKWCSVQLSKKELVYCRNWNYLVFDHL